MRSIKETLFKKLAKQADEAEIQGLSKVASNLTSQMEKNAGHIRRDQDFYLYASADLEADLENGLWDLVVRAADYYNATPDGEEMQDLVERAAADLLQELRTKLGVEHGVGAFEPSVPGEERQVLSLEIDE